MNAFLYFHLHYYDVEFIKVANGPCFFCIFPLGAHNKNRAFNAKKKPERELGKFFSKVIVSGILPLICFYALLMEVSVWLTWLWAWQWYFVINVGDCISGLRILWFCILIMFAVTIKWHSMLSVLCTKLIIILCFSIFTMASFFF